jgi:aryl-alcohol dehydrogenase-like predicted oxidoreductase
MSYDQRIEPKGRASAWKLTNFQTAIAMAAKQPTKRFHPKNMLFRYLGDTGLKVSVLGLGGWLTYGSENGVQEVEQTAACLQEAWDHGINFFDTAEVYADGQSEIIMGRALRLCNFERDDYVISTKLMLGDGERTHGLSRGYN